MKPKFFGLWLLAVPLANAGPAFGAPSEDLLASLEPPALAQLAAEVLERNPGLARARHRAAAAAARAPQARALPDPKASLTWFALPREDRTGPEELSVAWSQSFPGFGKLALREQVALRAVEVAEAEVEILRLDLLTDTRRHFYELAFHDLHREIVEAELDTLSRYEEAARARYSAGTGTQQDVLRLQAQITRIDARLLEIARQERRLLTSLNALRDRRINDYVSGLVLSVPAAPQLDPNALAARGRPEIVAAEARVLQARALAELARKEFRPELTMELGFTLVGSRDDPASRVMPPPDEGDDILWLTGSVNLPVRRRKLEAGLEEARAGVRVAEAERRQVEVTIERELGGLGARLQSLYTEWRLLEELLGPQAREALRSAEAAYATGKYNAVDLLESEVVLLDVRTSAARTLADYYVTSAELERAMARPLSRQGT